MTSSLDVDVLVVGYGPVGAAVAGLLGRHGVRTLVVDKSQEILTAPRAISLDNEALRILQMVGLAEQAFARTVIPYVRMHSPYVGEFARINTSGDINGHPKLVTFYQPDLERALRANAEQHASVCAWTGVEMVSFTDEGDCVSAALRTAGGKEVSVRTRYLVGADGASSQVRAAIGESFCGATYAQDWLVVDVLGVPSPFDHVEFLCNPKRPTPHMVAPGGRTRWEFMLQPGENRDEMETLSTLAELLRPWAKLDEICIERKAVYRFHARACSRFRRGRIFLAGDAAHVTPPFVGQGLVAGLRDAANLSWKLAWVVLGRASPKILDSYDQERRPHANSMIALARRMGWLVMPRTRLHAWVLHGGIKLLRKLSWLRSLIDDLGIKPSNTFARGLFRRGRGVLRHGSTFPQGLLRDASGKLALSDEALGAGLALVTIGSASAPPLAAETSDAWLATGGSVVAIAAQKATLPGALEDLEGSFPAVPQGGWCVVVRPDRTVLHDGPVRDVDRIVRESIEILGSR